MEEPWQMELEKQYILLQALEAQEDATMGCIPKRIFFLASTVNVPQTDMAYHIMDHVLFRDTVQPILDVTAFARFITCDNEYEIVIPDESKLSIDELLKTRNSAQRITIPQDLLSCITLIRARLNSHSTNDDQINPATYLSDYRWKQIIRLLQIVAMYNCRSSIDCSDLMLLTNLLWNHETQKITVYQTVTDTIVGDYLATIHRYEKQLNSLRIRVKDEPVSPEFAVFKDHLYRLYVTEKENFFQKQSPLIFGPDFDKLSDGDTVDAFIYKHRKTNLNIIRTMSGYSEEGHITPPEGAQMLKLGKSFAMASIDERYYIYMRVGIRIGYPDLHPQLYAERDQLAIACKDLQTAIQNRQSAYNTQDSNLFLTKELHKELSEHFSKMVASIKSLIVETKEPLE